MMTLKQNIQDINKFASPFLSFTNRNMEINSKNLNQPPKVSHFHSQSTTAHDFNKLDIWGSRDVKVSMDQTAVTQPQSSRQKGSPLRMRVNDGRQSPSGMKKLDSAMYFIYILYRYLLSISSINIYRNGRKSPFKKSLIISQLKIDQTFRSSPAKAQVPQSAASYLTKNRVGSFYDRNEAPRTTTHHVMESQLNRSRGRIDRMKSIDAELDFQLRLQRDSLERKTGVMKNENNWYREFTRTRDSSTQRMINPNIQLSEIMRMSNRLGTITISEIPQLSHSYLLELQNLSSTVSRLVQQSTQRKRF